MSAYRADASTKTAQVGRFGCEASTRTRPPQFSIASRSLPCYGVRRNSSRNIDENVKGAPRDAPSQACHADVMTAKDAGRSHGQ